MHDYWQLPRHPDSQERQLFITLESMYGPTRLPLGNLNTKSHIHKLFSGLMPPKLRDVLMLWMHGMVFPANNVNDLLAHINSLLQLYEKLNVKLHPGKCHLYETEVD